MWNPVPATDYPTAAPSGLGFLIVLPGLVTILGVMAWLALMVGPAVLAALDPAVLLALPLS